MKGYAERQFERYTIVVFPSRWGDHGPVYDLYEDYRRIPCMTRAEERRYPRRAARLGNQLVQEIAARLAVGEQVPLFESKVGP